MSFFNLNISLFTSPVSSRGSWHHTVERPLSHISLPPFIYFLIRLSKNNWGGSGNRTFFFLGVPPLQIRPWHKPKTGCLLSYAVVFFRYFITLTCSGICFADAVVVCVRSTWPTEWTCPTARWAASCAAAPDRRCLPASWCVMQIYTRPPASTCCTTPSITSSWLPQSWSVLSLSHTPAQKNKSFHGGLSSSHSPSWTLSDAPRGGVSKLGRLVCHQQYCHDEEKLRLLLWCSIWIWLDHY